MKFDKKFLKPIFASLGAVAIISSASVLFGNKPKANDISAADGGSGTEATFDSTGSGDNTDSKVALEIASQKTLAVSENKCRGCGKCVRIDAEHFALDIENRVAIVISTDNLDSDSLRQAAAICPEGAIIIS